MLYLIITCSISVAFFVALSSLEVLHIYWASLIIKMIIEALSENGVAGFHCNNKKMTLEIWTTRQELKAIINLLDPKFKILVVRVFRIWLQSVV